MHRKQIYRKGITSKLDQFRFGNYALVASSNGILTEAQLNAARVAIKRKIRSFGGLWIRIKPNKIITCKSSGIRMGKGKGSFHGLVYSVLKDEILIELQLGNFVSFAKRLLILAASKLSVRSYIKIKSKVV